MQTKWFYILAWVTFTLVASTVVTSMASMGFLSSGSSASSETSSQSYIIEAEYAVGEWNTGFMGPLGIMGTYINASEELPGPSHT